MPIDNYPGAEAMTDEHTDGIELPAASSGVSGGDSGGASSGDYDEIILPPATGVIIT